MIDVLLILAMAVTAAAMAFDTHRRHRTPPARRPSGRPQPHHCHTIRPDTTNRGGL